MKALLVIDMLLDFIDPGGALYIGPAAGDITPRVVERLEEHRVAGDLILFLCDHHLEDDEEFTMFPPHGLAQSHGAAIIPELAPRSGERIINKRRFSSFSGTDLDITLREKGIRELELCGLCTNICVLYTAADARMLNYKVTVHRDAVASFSAHAHSFALGELENTLGVNLV